jgi:hypothetical protein
MTSPQVAFALAWMLREPEVKPVRIARFITRQLQRNEASRWYDWMKLNLLPPRRLRMKA